MLAHTERVKTAYEDSAPFRRPRGLLWLALVIQLGLGVWYALLTPAYEGPDENDHVYYAYFLHSTGQLPIVKGSAGTAGRPAWDEAVLAHHPPLYYLLEARLVGDRLPAWRLNPEFGAAAPSGSLHKLHGADETAQPSTEIAALHRMRFLSVLCGLVSVALTWILGRQLWPERRQIAGVAALLLACVPQWTWMHGTVENGNLATTLALVAIVLLVGAVRRHRLSRRRALMIGTFVGAALATKLTSIFLLPLCGLVWAFGLWRWPEKGRTLAAGALALLAIAACSGWFFLRNATLYHDPLGLTAHEAAFAGNRLVDVAAATGRNLSDVRFEYLTGAFIGRSLQTTVGGFGWRGDRVPFAEWFAIAIAILAGAGWIRKARSLTRQRALALLTVLAAIALVTLGLVRFNWTFVQPQGRYLFPAFGPVLVLVAAGLVGLLEVHAGQLRRFAGLLLIAPPIVALGALTVVAKPLFDARLAPANDPYFASLIAGVTTPPADARATIEVTAPADGAGSTAPPILQWREPGAPPTARYTVHLVLPSGLGLGAYESAGIEIAGPAWTLPASIWERLPVDVPIALKVRRLPDRARGEGVRDVPESQFHTVVRRR